MLKLVLILYIENYLEDCIYFVMYFLNLKKS